jgi:hypothetical protein
VNPLRALFDAVTYRTHDTNPDPAADLVITPGRFGARTMHDPRIADFAEARRRRMLRQGLDPVDRALMDPATLALLHATAARMQAEEPRAGAAAPDMARQAA